MLIRMTMSAALVAVLGGCGLLPPASAGDDAPVVAESYLTVRDHADNVDSVAVWHGGDRDWLIATAKDTDKLILFDAATGEYLRDIGGPGDGPGRFRRPNGISVVDDLLIVVERDNRRLQVFSLPELESLGHFGSEHLTLPYGLWVHPQGDDRYRVYVTDAYEAADEQVPPHSELDRRLHAFTFQRTEDGVTGEWLRSAGEIEGEGVLREVESLWADPRHGQLLVADEAANRLNIKVFDMTLKFTGRVIGGDVFEHQPEGITQYACDDGGGYWIVADQHETVNTFRFFDRESLDYLGGFEGETTLNTDGIWLTREAMPGFPAGAFYAVHDDGNVAAFRLDRMLEAMDLPACR